MSDNKIQAILDTTMDKLKAMVNADVITGDPIVVDGLTLIPVSKVAYGIATGGSDFATKNQQNLFGGGSGAGVTVSPIAFMVIKDGIYSCYTRNGNRTWRQSRIFISIIW